MKMIEEARNLDRLNQRQEAILAYRQYLALEAGDAGAWADYGGLLMILGRLEEAREACHKALSIDKANGGALVNLGCVLTHSGHLVEAEEAFRRVLARDPHRLDARLALAECLIKKEDLTGARAQLAKAVELDPGNPSAHQYLGQIFHRLGLWPEYREEIQRFLLTDPTSSYVEYELGFLNLLFGNMTQGWQGYEARFKLPGLVGPERHFTEPRWQGEAFPGRTLLLHYEQGFGDTLMFVRFAPQVKALGGRVLLAAQAPLADLVATCQGVDEVIPHGAPLPPFDLQSPLLSLPGVLHTNLASIPAEIPYLDVPDRVPNREQISAMLARTPGAIRIGLVWTGSSLHKNDLVRSLPAAALRPLAGLPGVAWHSFQLGVEDSAPLPGIIPLAPLLSNFSDTAFALRGMDLVITVDTALAHLAGALGMPTFLLVPFSPDWRWLLGREDSPWYPTMRIYRQPEPGDWDGVIRQILDDLVSG